MTDTTLRSKLIGSWQLVSYEESFTDGSGGRRPFGDHPSGFILYNEDGYMSALLVPTAGMTGLQPVAYAGPFETDEAKQVVRHHPGASIIAPWVNRVQARRAMLEGDTLILSTVAPVVLNGSTSNATLVWKKTALTSR